MDSIISSFLYSYSNYFNTLRLRQHGRHFPDDIFKCIFLNENVWTSIQISLKFVPKGPIDNIPALVQIMAWRPPGGKPLSEPMLIILLTHICVTWPQWVNKGWIFIVLCRIRLPRGIGNYNVSQNMQMRISSKYSVSGKRYSIIYHMTFTTIYNNY